MNFFLFLLTASFWSGSFIAIEPLVKAMPPLLAATLRLAVAIAFLSVVLWTKRIPYWAPKKMQKKISLTGFFAFGVPFALLFWGETSISAGLAGIINGTVPIWVFILGALFTPRMEGISLRKIVGLFLGILGVTFIFLPQLISSAQHSSLLATAAILGMAISYAVAVLFNRSLFAQHPGLHPFTNLNQQLWAGVLTLLILSLLFEGWPRPGLWNPRQTVLVSELYLGCVSTGMAFMIFYSLIKSWGSVRAATMAYVVPVLTLALDFILNQKIPTLFAVLGVTAITCGVMILNAPSSKKILPV